MKVNPNHQNAQAQATAQQRKAPVAPRQTQQGQEAQQTHETQAVQKHTKLKVGVKVDVQA
jgi:hypothetical protein